MLTQDNDYNEPSTALTGAQQLLAAFVLALANFIVVLDMTIANVIVPQIAGTLGASSTEGTYVITSYAIAEAVIVPLTGWLTARYGMVKSFSVSIFLFAIFSAMCGVAQSLGFLVVARVLQGLAGGPIMPLSQTLLMLIFPKEKQMTGMAIWSVTTLVAPILGPIVGGYITDNWSWHGAFMINVPLGIVFSIFALTMLKPFENKTKKAKVDFVGLLLLIIFVGAVQFILDEGEKLDWFSSPLIQALSVVAIIGFVSFLIWELTQPDPIVNLGIFRHRGFSISMVTMSLMFSAFLGVMVLTPLWLQLNMGYTSTWAGYVMSANGVLAILVAPLVAKFAPRIDLRKIISLSILWLGIVSFWRAFGNSDMAYFDIMWPILVQGAAMPCFFIPLMNMALSSVAPQEMASAAGMLNFLRTTSGAFGTSVTVTVWGNLSKISRSDLAGYLNPHDIPVIFLDRMVEGQSLTIGMNQTLLWAGLIFVIASLTIWFVPKSSAKPQTPPDLSGAH